MLSINRLSIELKFRNCKRSSADMSNFCCDDLNESLSEASCMPHCAQASPRSSPYRLGASLPVSNSRKPDSCPPNGSRNPSVSDCFCRNRRNSASPPRTSARSATKFREIIVRHADPFQMVRLTGVTQKPVSHSSEQPGLRSRGKQLVCPHSIRYELTRSLQLNTSPYPALILEAP